MKTGNYSVLFSIVSNMAIGLCFIPFLFLGWKKIRQVNTFWMLGIYWLFNGLVNLPMLHKAGGAHGTISRLALLFAMAEAPLLLVAFAGACSGRERKVLWWTVLGYTVTECLLVGLKGHTMPGSLLISGVGTLLILVFSATGLVQYVRKMEHSRFENSMVFVYAAILFFYGSSLIIYIFAHHSGSNGNDNTDSFLLYYISLMLSAIVTLLGLWSYGIRKTEKPRRPRPMRAPGYSSSSS
ncbi:MAG: hypothetical protein JST68_28940 [Bacteroidetes bacterium]|nr:hypothetical protein [Bacteroidota bacterium]